MTQALMRALAAADAPACAAILFDSVQGRGRLAYEPAQVEAWAPSPLDPAVFTAAIAGGYGLGALRDGRLIGFILCGRDGRLDCFYVESAAAGQGIGAALLAAFEDEMRARDMPALTTQASLLLQPMLERRGWRNLGEEIVTRNGVGLARFVMEKRLGPAAATIAAQAGHALDPATGAVAPPIQPATTFARDFDYALKGPYLYARYGGPTDGLAEAIIAKLEGARGAKSFPSGLAAIAAILDLLPAGAHIVAPRAMYYAAKAWMRRQEAMGRLCLSEYDNSDLASLERAVAARTTHLIWAETPANPSWEVTDLAGASAIAKRAGALLGVDGTCAPPVTTRALDWGADLVMHSATKYLNGHSDVTAGVVSTRDASLLEGLEAIRRATSAPLAAFEAWLLVRGMRTLEARFRRQSASAMELAHWLADQDGVERVLFPGLPSHPGHELAARQMRGGFGAMISFIVEGGLAAAKQVATACKVFIPATSLGSVESLIEHRKPVEGPSSLVPDGLLRLSVGLEDVEDLRADLAQALAGLAGRRGPAQEV